MAASSPNSAVRRHLKLITEVVVETAHTEIVLWMSEKQCAAADEYRRALPHTREHDRIRR